MNIIQNTDESQLKEVLLHYKHFYLPLGIIVVSILLLLMVILPQIQQYTNQQDEIKQVEERIAILKKNIQYVGSINDEAQAADIQVATYALPGDKDYAGILYAVRIASSKSGVRVGDYTFSVGELSPIKAATKNIPVITMDLNVNGDLKDVSIFLAELAKIFPLSDVSEISLSNNFSQLVVTFYYKPIPSLKVNYTNPILPITGTSQKLLETLRSWRAERPVFDLTLPTEGSESASPF